MELMVGVFICVDPASVIESLDLGAQGVELLTFMWGTRQFALGVIFGLAAFKRSVPMLTICFVFLLVMFAGDLLAGLNLQEQSLVIGGVVMSFVSGAMIWALNRKP